MHDKMEFLSFGTLVYGLNIQVIKQGYSMPRNAKLANIFINNILMRRMERDSSYHRLYIKILSINLDRLSLKSTNAYT